MHHCVSMFAILGRKEDTVSGSQCHSAFPSRSNCFVDVRFFKHMFGGVLGGLDFTSSEQR